MRTVVDMGKRSSVPEGPTVNHDKLSKVAVTVGAVVTPPSSVIDALELEVGGLLEPEKVALVGLKTVMGVAAEETLAGKAVISTGTTDAVGLAV
jgi:hypothetical protein